MEYIINQFNYKDFLFENAFLNIDGSIVNEIMKSSDILRIENIHEKIGILLCDICESSFKIEIDKTSVISIDIKNIEIDSLSFFNVKNSEKDNSSFNIAALKIGSSKINYLYFLDSQFLKSISIGNNTTISHFDIRNTLIDKIFSLSQVNIKSLSIYKSILDDVNFSTNTYDSPFKLCSIDSISFHSCDINNSVIFEDVLYNFIEFKLVNILKKKEEKISQSLSIVNNHSIGKDFNISIIKSTIPVHTTLRVKKIEKLIIEESSLEKLYIQFEIANVFGIHSSTFSDNANLLPNNLTNNINKL
jgi:hypothetical protein